jgi:hypothetical protein
MPRYIAKAVLVMPPDGYTDGQILGADVVFEQTPEEPVYIGLVNSAGVPLYRVSETRAIGFLKERR